MLLLVEDDRRSEWQGHLQFPVYEVAHVSSLLPFGLLLSTIFLRLPLLRVSAATCDAVVPSILKATLLVPGLGDSPMLSICLLSSFLPELS